ncbi:hypothetical protein HPB47_026099 [Ixodes persulcatus]|uniref:Uncharacterized protein n=1 Tax=Ixodes persulcatus TaxID=34615 RepID=A0AC60Q240_IXOPE|nr:hypothetical protein HPB47_026099 [Ixodes persulcatus]
MGHTGSTVPAGPSLAQHALYRASSCLLGRPPVTCPPPRRLPPSSPTIVTKNRARGRFQGLHYNTLFRKRYIAAAVSEAHYQYNVTAIDNEAAVQCLTQRVSDPTQLNMFSADVKACHLDAATPVNSGDLGAAPDPPYALNSTPEATLATPGEKTALRDRHALPRLPPGALHHNREDRQRALVRAGSRALTPADIEAALVIVGRACPERLRPTLTLPPEMANVRLSDNEM